MTSAEVTATSLAEPLVQAWGSWGPTLSPDCRRVAFVSDRSGTPRIWVQEVPSPGTSPPPATMIRLNDDPAVAVSWSADGGWLACRVATSGGVRTQVWVVRPDGRDARLVAGGPGRHAELGPWTRSGHRVVVTIPGGEVDEDGVAYLVDPVSGDLTPLATGDLISVLDLSEDETYVIVKDGPRGHQFCVVVDRAADQDLPLLPYPALGSTERAMIRPAPEGDGLVAYLATDAGLPRRQLVAIPLGPVGWRGESGVLCPREDAELEGLDGDDAGRLLLLAWNVAGGRSELELLDTRTGVSRTAPDLSGVVTGALLSRDGSTAVMSVEGPLRPRELWSLDTATLVWTRVTEGPTLPEEGLVRPTLHSFPGRDGLPLTGWLYRPPGPFGPGPVVLSLHGGPEAQERPTFSPQHQALVAAGFAVFAPNIRGSSGFGRVFVHADDLHGRLDAFSDVLACRDFLIDLGIAHPDRMAIIGRSYGGYLTLATLAFSPGMFAAGIDICGMSDLHTFYRDTEPWIAAAAYTKYGHPEEDYVLLEAISPLRSCANIEVPLLVVHGELDTNVPIGESRQIVAALRELGRPVEYLQLDGEGHEYRRTESRRKLITRMVDFLSEHL
jgi:dipeptidyl aminopeptidase/acylaminoacyl peptidase